MELSVKPPIKPLVLAAFLALAFTPFGSIASASPNKLDIDNDGGGRFSGHAGSAWTEDQLPQQVGAQICDGALPRQFDLRILSGYWLFSGSC
jgi:hypothetical protein